MIACIKLVGKAETRTMEELAETEILFQAQTHEETSASDEKVRHLTVHITTHECALCTVHCVPGG